MRETEQIHGTQRIPGLYCAIVVTAILFCAACFVACSRPEKTLLGKWQSKPVPTYDGKKQQDGTKLMAFEFLEDGTVIYSKKWQQSRKPQQGHWEPVATGTFHLINSTRLKMDWGLLSALEAGPTVYEVDWHDSDHFKLQSGQGMTEFERVK